MTRSRRYTDAEKLGLMALALRDGVDATCEATGVPERTVYTWLQEAGGIETIRGYMQAATFSARGQGYHQAGLLTRPALDTPLGLQVT